LERDGSEQDQRAEKNNLRVHDSSPFSWLLAASNGCATKSLLQSWQERPILLARAALRPILGAAMSRRVGRDLDRCRDLVGSGGAELSTCRAARLRSRGLGSSFHRQRRRRRFHHSGHGASAVEFENQRDAERGAGGGEKKDRRIAARPDDGAGDGTGNPQRQIDKRRINGQGRAAVLGGHVAHGFHAQRGKYQRKAEAGDGGAEVRQRRRRREREQKKSGALDPQRQKRDSITAPATNGPGKKQARDDETAGEERERPAGVGPVAARVEKRDERSDGAEAETGQGETRAVGQHPAQHLAKAQAIAALDAHRSQRRGPEKSDQRERDRGCADGAGAGASFEPETAGSAGGQSAVGG